MFPVQIENATRTLEPPKGWDPEKHGRCGGLPTRQDVINGVPYLHSNWEPTPAEMVKLNAGGKVQLGVSATVHPVVHMGVTDPPCLFDDEGKERSAVEISRVAREVFERAAAHADVDAVAILVIGRDGIPSMMWSTGPASRPLLPLSRFLTDRLQQAGAID